MTTLRVYRAEVRPGHAFGVLFGRDPRGRTVYTLDDAHVVWTTIERLQRERNFVDPPHRV